MRGGQETVSCGACATNADPRLAMETRAAKRRRLDAPCCTTPWLTLPRGILMHVFELGLKCLGRDVVGLCCSLQTQSLCQIPGSSSRVACVSQIANARLACREWHSVYREVQEQDTCCSRPGRYVHRRGPCLMPCLDKHGTLHRTARGSRAGCAGAQLDSPPSARAKLRPQSTVQAFAVEGTAPVQVSWPLHPPHPSCCSPSAVLCSRQT